MFPIGYKVTVEGKYVEGDMEDVTDVQSIDEFVKAVQERWGKNATIEIYVWRANWSS